MKNSCETMPLDKQLLSRSYIYGFIINVVTYMISFYFPRKENKLFYDLGLGIIFTYIVDILLIQKYFKNFDTHSLEQISYSNMIYRLKYLFQYRIFLKYLIVVVISSILVSSLIRYTKRNMEKYKLFNNNLISSAYMDLIINIFFKFVVTAIFMNFIKFRWAYVDNNDIYLTAIIISLLNLSVLSSL